MCITAGLARLNNTRGMVNPFTHPEVGEAVAVAYQNQVKNLRPGGNAMIIYFPADGMSQKNFVDTSACPNILEDMVDAITPKTRGFTKGMPSLGFDDDVRVFDHGIYTVVLTPDASLIPTVLESGAVPEEKRPQLGKELFNWFAQERRGYSFALCCFNNQEARQASPILVWYKSKSHGYLHFPGVDAHDGGAPDLDAMVDVDHTIVIGSEHGLPVTYTDNIPANVRIMLPDRVIGKMYDGLMINGDFLYNANRIQRGVMDVIRE